MNEPSLTMPPACSRFGWPQNKRLEELLKLYSTPPKATYRVPFQGQNLDIAIVRVSIDLPKYRIANGRTASLQAEHLVKNPAVRRDIFSGDPELWDAQEAQHSLLLLVVRQQELYKYFEDVANKQIDPILLDERGFVINGNRRLSCWRELHHHDSLKYAHFAYVDVAALPHCDEKDIDRIEATLQIKKDIKADYSWDAQANMLLDKQKRDSFSNKELAELYGMKESEIVELIDMRNYADSYLRSRNKTDRWSQVSDQEFAFRKIVTSRPKIQTMGDQEVFMEAAFTLIENPDEAGGRLYEQIPAILDSLEHVKDRLSDEFPLQPKAPSIEVNMLFGSVSTPQDDEKLPPKPSTVLLAEEIRKPENSTKARRIIVEVIESQKQLKKDSKAAGYLLDCCTKAHSQLSAAAKEGLRPESIRKGVSKQLDEIEKQVEHIRKYLAEHAEN